MQNESCDNNDHAGTSEILKERAIKSIFDESKKLHILTTKLFADTPYQPSLWPERWQYMALRLKPHISEASYATLMLNEVDVFSGKLAPVRFRAKLAAFDEAFDAEIPNLLKVIDEARAVLTVSRRNPTYKPGDVKTFFSKYIINRPRELPFPEYEYGVGISDDDVSDDDLCEDDSPQRRKVCKNGRRPNRIYYMTTELVLMISLLMTLPRDEVFMKLFPYKMQHALTEEWTSMKPVFQAYYDNLNHYASMEVIFDDLLTLLGCYALYCTQGNIRSDSEKILVFLTSVCKQALQVKRFAVFVERFADTDNLEGRLQVVFNILFPKSMKHFAPLHRRVEASLDALCCVRFGHIQKLVTQWQPNHQVLYPTFA